MRRAKYILCLIFMMYAVSLAGQSRSELREMFISAEGDILFEDYAEALPKYLSLLQIYPENYNFYYRIGQCYLNTPGEKDKSIPYLETAARNINRQYRAGKFTETGAPYDVLYHLANAYRIANDLDRALVNYDLFLQDVNTKVYDTALVRFQMKTCHNARQMIRKPVYIVDRNLGSIVNDRFSEFSPVISADEKSLLFTRALQFYDAVFWSTKVNGTWTEPVNLTPQLGVDQDYYTSSLTHDGQTLLLYRIDTYDGNIYSSQLDGEIWSNVEKLNTNINTKYWESHATMSRDGRKLFFTSNRRESLGGLDIFVSERDSTGDWGPAKNIGPEINTIYDEETPFLANNDRTLFFSSRGHFNMGGYDIFRSDLGSDGRWSTPVNIGYPLNTTDDDIFFMPLGKGDRGCYSRFADDGQGRMDIFICDIYSELNPRSFIVTGRASVAGLLSEFPQPVTVTAVSNGQAGLVITASTNPLTGIYSFRLPQGAYSFKFDSDGAESQSKSHELPLNNTSDTIMIDPVILVKNDFSAYLRLLSDTLIKVNSPEPVSINLRAEERSVLIVEVRSTGSDPITEQYSVSDSAFTFTFVPEKGENRISFRLTDRFGNDTAMAVRVSRRDAATVDTKPLYREIPVRPAGEKAEEKPVDKPVAVQEETTASESGSEGVTPVADETDSRGSCQWWWLLIAAALIILFLLWKRKRKKDDKDL